MQKSKACQFDAAVKKIKTKLSRNIIDAFLITCESNVRYLLKFYLSSSIFLVTRSRIPVYFVDSMNFTLARERLKHLNVEVVRADGSVLQAFAKYAKDIKIKKIAMDNGDLPLSLYNRLTKIIPRTKYIFKTKSEDYTQIIGSLRVCKNSGEIKILRKAAKETVSIWGYAKRRIKIGMSEKEISKMIDLIILDKGYKNSFPTIAAVGANTAYPHAIPTSRRLKKGEHVLVDFGIKIDGYCSDLTRTLDKGRIDRQIQDFRKAVLMAQEKAIREIKPGVEIGALTQSANDEFFKHKLDKFLLHGLGHGVGLDIHEKPFLSGKSTVKLKEGMVVTIEPGLYKKGLGGIREEDMILVTKKGYEVLTK